MNFFYRPIQAGNNKNKQSCANAKQRVNCSEAKTFLSAVSASLHATGMHALNAM